MHAKKRLGQNFLSDPDIARHVAMATTEGLAVDLPILEVGGGRGALTRHLLNLEHDLRVVEFDDACVHYLLQNFPSLDGRLVQADFLKLSLETIFRGERFMLVGNYPYNISSQIIIKVLQNRDLIPVCGGMFQDEVARRLAAPPGGRVRGILSVLLQAWYDVEYLFSVPPSAFIPQPKVTSGVVRIQRNQRTDLGCDERLFITIVKTTFNQRRKMLRHTLRPLLPPSEQASQFLSLLHLQQRPEQLSVEQFIELTNQVMQLRQ